ncbi:MAG: thiaminase II [Alphaproteobacteria bacterium]|nr:thiaminase II [Alphaproteobacteria bacterium]
MSLFSERVWQSTTPLRHKIHSMPFNAELASGTLSRDRFQYYIIQDSLYLAEYSRVLALAAARSPDMEQLQAFAKSALGAVAVEQSLHERYLAEFGVTPDELASSVPSPECSGYTSFLLAAAYHESWEVLIAALLPCFWLYWDVGTSISKIAKKDNPYRAWIDTYADDHFAASVQRVIKVTDDAAARASIYTRRKMATAFVRCCQYEWLFWDSAYSKNSWPLSESSLLPEM